MHNDLTVNTEFDKVEQIKTNKMEKVKISKVEVIKMIEEGYSKESIREDLYPTLNENQWRKFLKVSGLSGKRSPKIDFIIEDETVVPQSQGTNPSFNQVDKL